MVSMSGHQGHIRVWPFEEGQKEGDSCQPPYFYAKQNNNLKRQSITSLLSNGVKDAFFLNF